MRTQSRRRPAPPTDQLTLGEVPSAPPKPAEPAEAVECVPAAPAPPKAAEAPQRPILTWVDEVGAMPAGLVMGLPLAVSLRLQLRGTSLDVWACADRERYAALRRRREPVFTPNEWAALVCAVMHDRAGVGMADWVRRKTTAPHWELTRDVALGDVTLHAPTLSNPSVRVVCDAWLAELVAVEVGV